LFFLVRYVLRMDEPPKPSEKLADVSRDELLFDLEFGMKFQDGKARQRAAVDAAVATVARMIAAHLARAGYVIKRKPPASGHSTTGSPGYKSHLTE
jgi:hypothetical protein